MRWPCPPWLIPLLENPYVGALLGSGKLIDRAGVSPGMRVLDVGCGPGRLAIPAAARVAPRGFVVALDIQPAMLRRLARRAKAHPGVRILLVRGSASALPFRRATFDRALVVTVLGEVRDRTAALKDLHATIKPGGLLSVSELVPDPHYQSRSRVRRLAERAGFRFRSGFGSWFAFTLNLVRGSEN
ncbi:MAG: class I SAM-dependent methyltransferase [Planctomycetota bacterium]